jgi:oligopeptide/dipeptide ABC transporter ATP-binding protein
MGEAAQVYAAPAHPYTRALLAAVPEVGVGGARRERIRLAGDTPASVQPPSGCRFRTRCPKSQELCATVEPALASMPGGQVAACHFPETEPIR